MGTTPTYYRLRQENKELKEKLTSYENGFPNLSVESNVIHTSESFEKIFRSTKKDLKAIWENSEKRRKLEGRGSGESLNEYTVGDFLDRLCDVPNVVVTFIIGKETERISLQRALWEWIKVLGDDDPSVGWDKLVRLIPSE